MSSHDKPTNVWLEHTGGDQPVANNVHVEILMRCGETDIGPAGWWWWGRAFDDPEIDIVSYRIVENTDG